MKSFTCFFDSANLLNKLDFNIYVDRDILFKAPIKDPFSVSRETNDTLNIFLTDKLIVPSKYFIFITTSSDEESFTSPTN